jgi:type IV pilus assembly protein PilA
MIVVAIIGILAAVAIPAFMRYIRRSKTSEATMNLRKLFDSSVAYYNEQHAGRDGDIVAQQFPLAMASTPGSPASACAAGESTKIAPSDAYWSAPSWQMLNFAVHDPHYYVYTYESAGTGKESMFTARANGDLDCNNVYSTFERVGTVNDHNYVTGGAGIYAQGELE